MKIEEATKQPEAPVMPGRFRRAFDGLRQWLRDDWHGQKYVACGLLLLVVTLLVTICFYLDYPHVELNADTPAYLHVVDAIRERPYRLVDAWRLPGYPLLIVLVYALTGQNNLTAVGIVQAGLFVLTTLEIYVLAILIFRRAWLALIIGLLVGTNIVFLSFIKPIMSEGLAMFELTTLTLATVCFLRRGRGLRYIALALVPLIFTRPEWLYLAPLLYVYLLLMAVRKGTVRHLFKKVLIASVALYAMAGLYIGINGVVHHYFGMTAIENFNWAGKILQYNMWHEAPPESQHISQQLDHLVATIDNDPYHILGLIPELKQDNYSPAGHFARDIILHHPVEFFVKSVPYFFASLTSYFNISRDPHTSTFTAMLGHLKSLDHRLYNMNALFPLCALGWLLALCWKRLRAREDVAAMGLLVLLGIYGIVITTLGGYRLDDYMRVHMVFNPLLILITWGSVLFVISMFVRKVGAVLSSGRNPRSVGASDGDS
ncbi:MAG: hypothetical protein J2P37_21080 [Ktedonobacteraceae bacterium]|nr:hypothetical protein [Ktedonobacteraceae bacterium]MBO0793504.1 hypothetical protein [Ktedonobacteraceae bacterium]